MYIFVCTSALSWLKINAHSTNSRVLLYIVIIIMFAWMCVRAFVRECVLRICHISIHNNFISFVQLVHVINNWLFLLECSNDLLFCFHLLFILSSMANVKMCARCVHELADEKYFIVFYVALLFACVYTYTIDVLQDSRLAVCSIVITISRLI